MCCIFQSAECQTQLTQPAVLGKQHLPKEGSWKQMTCIPLFLERQLDLCWYNCTEILKYAGPVPHAPTYFPLQWMEHFLLFTYWSAHFNFKYLCFEITLKVTREKNPHLLLLQHNAKNRKLPDHLLLVMSSPNLNVSTHYFQGDRSRLPEMLLPMQEDEPHSTLRMGAPTRLTWATGSCVL